MFKDTNDGQTYFDPEAERKAREPMQDLIKESASEFINDIDNYVDYHGEADKEDIEPFIQKDNILDWHTKQMEKAYEKGREKSDVVLKKLLEFREDTRNDGFGQYVSTIDECIKIVREN